MKPIVTEMKVEGLFLDYDGTISPISVSRQESAVPPKLASILYRISRQIPVGIITTKDLSFIVPRTPFASIWCGIAGMEMKIGDKIVEEPRIDKALPQISLAIKKAEEMGNNVLYIERKFDSRGRVVAFCVDWRKSRDLSKAMKLASEIATYCKSLCLWVIEYQRQPFFDVYPFETDKGKAMIDSMLKLGIKNGVIYMGDSKVDNPAFEVADVSIGVLHEESALDLECDYYIRFENMVTFLRRLLANHLTFQFAMTVI